MNLQSILKSIYAFYITCLGKLFFWVKPKKRIVLIASFPDNARAILKAYENDAFDFKLKVLLTQHAKGLANEFPNQNCSVIDQENPVHIVKAIHCMLSSKAVLIDNYYLMVTALRHRPDIECIQIWHANGAFKKFGLKDLTIQNYSERDFARYKKVYRSFDKIVVGSEHMAHIFQESFGVEENHFLKIGVPMTDMYFEKETQSNQIRERLAISSEKKILLYAPTFRDEDFGRVRLPFKESHLKDDLNEEYVLLIKLHPVMKNQFSHVDSPWIKDVSDIALDELLKACDILISDYSSVPFEFALLNKPVLFFTYDLEEYDKKRGLIDNYLSVIPGKACSDAAMLIEQLKDTSLLKREVKQFSNEWNRYSEGNSTQRLLDYLTVKMN
ncbi:CDP-glycerol glycerophosphotransferase family protein [Bacillus gobiensis]|uniref:CDP-glycerol glycerophosphotransferase family protein n=1 Tax=Bacillus gobiensis TaxID=1441095 RepID=UPI003D1D547F